MPAKKKTVAKRVVRQKRATATPEPNSVVRRRRVVKVVAPPEPTVDRIITETEIVKEPRIEIRKPATLAQALTEPAVAVIKPQTKVVSRVIKAKRGKKAA
jgi:hypothetical protein